MMACLLFIMFIMMRLLLLGLFIASTVSAKTPLSLPAKRALARQISEILVLSRMHPTIIVPPPSVLNKPEADILWDYFREYVRNFENRLTIQTPLLESYVKHLQQDPSVDMVGFTDSIYNLAEKTAIRYVGSKGDLADNGMLYRFGHRWGQNDSDPVAQMSAGERKLELRQVFVNGRDARVSILEKQGDSSSLELHRELAKYYQSDPSISEIIADYTALIEAIPSFDTKLTKREVEHLLNYAEGGITSYPEVTQEAVKIINLAVGRGINLRRLLDEYGLPADFIAQQLPRILEHLDQRRVVIADLTGEGEPLVINKIGHNQDLAVAAMQKLRELQRESASHYMAIRQKDVTSTETDYVLLEVDVQGRWQIAPDKKITSDSILQHSRISLEDMVDKDIIDSFLDERFLGKLNNQVKELMLSSSAIRKSNNNSTMNVTYAQLQDSRTIYEATWELLSKMEWSWYKFSKIIYPQDRGKAALFVANYRNYLVHGEMVENALRFYSGNSSNFDSILKVIQEALTAEKTKLSDNKKIEAIENFLIELPSLVAKATVTYYASEFKQEGALTEDRRKKALFEKAIKHEQLSEVRWSNTTYLDFELEPQDSIFRVIHLLQQYGMTEKQLKDNIFTEAVFSKLVEGKIVTEKNLNEMRKILDEQKIRDIVSKINNIEEENKNTLVEIILFLPLFIQRDGFAKKFARGISSPRDFQTALRNVEENSMYRPIATLLLDEVKNGQKEILNQTIEKIKNINSVEGNDKKNYHYIDNKHIVYFVLPVVHTLKVGDTYYTIPVVKVGQVNYSKEYMKEENNESTDIADIKKLQNHPRFKQLFAEGIDYKVLFGVSFPATDDHKVRALILELFENKGVRRADPDLLTGISSGDGATEFLEFTDNVVVEDGLPMVAVDKLYENIMEVTTAVYEEVFARIDKYGYVPVTTISWNGANSSSGDDKQVANEQAQDTGFLLRELPVELKPKEKRVKNNKKGQPPSRAPPQQKSKAQLASEAEAQARQELNDQITQLSNDIKRGKALPEGTPIWLHLRALFAYMGATPQELAERADIKDWKARFTTVVAPETTTLPSKEELQLIKTSLTKKIDKDKEISAKYKQEMLANLAREIESIEQKLIAHGLEQARPNATEQLSVPKVANSKPEDATSTVRLPNKGTLKKITAADMKDFLQGELLPSYQLFSELMLFLDVNTAQELTAKLNETLVAVNSKLVEQEDEKIQLLSVPLDTHLVGYELGNSDFIDRTMWKLQVVAEHIEHPHKTEIAYLLNDIVRAAKIQRFESVEQLNTALKNSKEDLRITAEQFAKIQEITAAALAEWQKDWQQ